MEQIKYPGHAPHGVAAFRAFRFVQGHAGVLATVLLFAAGSAALWRLLAPLKMADVAAHFHALQSGPLALALLATLIGYIALVGYDWSALQYLGKRVPTLQVGLGGFLGYSIGNTIGLSVVSGGAVRYRVYSRFGLSAADVLKVATFAALSYGLGATLIGLAALVIQPDAMMAFTALPVQTIRAASALGLVTLAGGLWALSRNQASRTIWRWTFLSPAPDLILRQVILTGIELVMGACVLFVLLPSGHGSFPGLIVLYAIATMIGILSHVPGGVGVFETVLLAGLPASLSAPAVLASLLLFRVIYFLLPFGIALVTFGVAEIMALRRKAAGCKTVIPPTGRAIPARPSFKDRVAIPLPLTRKDEDMKTRKFAALGAAMLLGAGVAGMAAAETETKDAAEMQQFLSHPQSLSQAIAAAEQAVGGKAMDAGWETSDPAGGGYHVEVVKTDGTMVDVVVSADGTTKIVDEAKDGTEGGTEDGGQDNGNDNG